MFPFQSGELSFGNSNDIVENINNNTFIISIPLEPGRYQYKFFADGTELLDPANPDKIPNGMGDYNSVLNVEPKHKTQPFLFVDEIKPDNNKFEYSFSIVEL